MIVKEILSDQASEYRRLRTTSEREFPQYVGANVEHELSLNQDELANLMLAYPKNGHYIFGMSENNRLLGAAALSRRSSQKYAHKLFLWGMFIYPEYRNTGIATLLIDHAISRSKESAEVIAIQLLVTTTNAKAISLYVRNGFKIFGTEPNHMFAAGKFHDAHLLELNIKG